jgi:hypothetical protein
MLCFDCDNSKHDEPQNQDHRRAYLSFERPESSKKKKKKDKSMPKDKKKKRKEASSFDEQLSELRETAHLSGSAGFEELKEEDAAKESEDEDEDLLEQIETKLNNYYVFRKLEAFTGAKKSDLFFLGLFMLPTMLVAVAGFRALCNIVAVCYPAYQSFKALREREMEAKIAALHNEEKVFILFCGSDITLHIFFTDREHVAGSCRIYLFTYQYFLTVLINYFCFLLTFKLQMQNKTKNALRRTVG